MNSTTLAAHTRRQLSRHERQRLARAEAFSTADTRLTFATAGEARTRGPRADRPPGPH